MEFVQDHATIRSDIDIKRDQIQPHSSTVAVIALLIGLKGLPSLRRVGILQLLHLQGGLELALAFVLLTSSNQDHSQVLTIFGGVRRLLDTLLEQRNCP